MTSPTLFTHDFHLPEATIFQVILTVSSGVYIILKNLIKLLFLSACLL